NMTDANGGIIIDHLNLRNVSINFSIKQLTEGEDEPVVKDAGKAKVKMSCDIDMLNLRMVDSRSTMGIGRLSIDGLQFNYAQKIRGRNISRSTTSIFPAMTFYTMIMKAPFMIMPLINGLKSKFSEAGSNNYDDLLAVYRQRDKDLEDFFGSIKEMLADELELSVGFDSLTISHLFLSDESILDEQADEGKLSYIEEIKFDGKADNAEQKPHEIKISSNKFTETELIIAASATSVTQLSAEAQEHVRSLLTGYEEQEQSALEAYEKLLVLYSVSIAGKKKKDKAIVEAVEYFERFRKLNLEVSSASGSIIGADMITNMVLPMVRDSLENTGATIKGLDGTGNIRYENLEVYTQQTSEGMVSNATRPNQISLDVILPKIEADKLAYNTKEIQFETGKMDLNTISLGVTISFNNPAEISATKDQKEPLKQYDYALSRINVAEASFENSRFSYSDQLAFSSGLTTANNFWFEMNPSVSPEHLGLGFDQLSLGDGKVSFGGRAIAADKDKSINLYGGMFTSDPSAMRFVLDDFEIEGTYYDLDDNTVKFIKEKRNIETNEPLIDYLQSNEREYKRVKLNMASTLFLP
ncbi:MAG: hypothetical protein WBA74_11270, partial [Cyclobacteriaceae bacterium]